MNARLVAKDDVLAIICKYENRAIQKNNGIRDLNAARVLGHRGASAGNIGK